MGEPRGAGCGRPPGGRRGASSHIALSFAADHTFAPRREQFAAVKRYLEDNPHIERVWYDYWVMPQGKRTPAELERFKWRLRNVNLLYLGSSVLVLVDMSYLSRFWT